ncbi:MAG: cytochrome c3 family protein [Planctomycetota bacterium]|jgi:predicted CXXCH cytochrome family protein
MLERIDKWAIILICVLISNGLAVEKPTTLQETCVTEECHADYSKKAFVHGPIGLGDCKSCHKPLKPEEHTWQYVRKGKDLCEYCHLDQATKKIVHEPLKTGDCIQCHDPHSSDNKFLIQEKTIASLCNNCHKITEGLQFLHGPTAVGECTVCHKSHSSDYKDLLVSDHAQLCFSCHVVTQNELKKYEFVHEPTKNDCIGCHDPHGGSDSNMVKDLAPFLCYTCHKDIQKIAENSPYQHSVVGDIDGCMNCHTPHASTVKFLLKKDATSLCITCHDKPQEIGDGEVLPAFTDELKGKKSLHGPVAENDCSGCHVTHGSKHFRLLAKKYPPIFYAPFSEENYELCFDCHAKSLVLNAKTNDLTDFRNGNINLHFLHVNKERRGRTCRACHQTHASNLPKHIRESVPYGTWDLPVGFTKTETGGSCKSGCHMPTDYDRNNPADYSVPSASP